MGQDSVAPCRSRTVSYSSRPSTPVLHSDRFITPSSRVIVPMPTLHQSAALIILAALCACSSGKSGGKADSAAVAQQQSMAGMPSMSAPVTIPKDAIFTAADVHFMQGMIAHHAQAIYMSRMAAAHGANPRVLRFATKIDQSQVAEIRLMQEWLRRNNQATPDTSSWRTMRMPGMLTAAQLKELDAAKGVDFDRTFLTLMIQHHEGALKMVSDLFAAPLAAQDVDVSTFATDVKTVQTAEIGTMHAMLDQLANH